MLRHFKIVRREHPELSGPDLYERVVARQGELGGRTAESVVRQATASFAAWPVERRVSFRDVVHCVVFDSYIKSHSGCTGTHSNLRTVVELIIPKAL